MKILITGTSRGIGRSLAELLATRGGERFEFFLVGRASDEQAETERLVRQLGCAVHFVPCDFSSRDSVDVALGELEMGSPFDLLIFNAACCQRVPFVQTTDSIWDEQMEVNVTTPFRMTRALLPRMLPRSSGRVLFVSSISAVVGTQSQAAYNASKAALVSVMRCLAEELSDTGLMTLAVLPGSVDTAMLQGSGFEPRMTSEDVARTLMFYALDAPLAHNGAAIEIYGV